MNIIKKFYLRISDVSPTKKRLLENYLSLSFLQAANYLFPLLTLPYLVRVLGPELFGFISFVQALIIYFQIFTDYGFSLSATREISINIKDKEKISEIFSAVIIIKFLLFTISFIALTIVILIFKKFGDNWIIYYLTFGMVLGDVLFPQWFFQGTERMKYITVLNVISRLIFTLSIFIFIRESSDYIYVPLLNSIGIIFAGLLALYVVFRKFDVIFKFPDSGIIKRQFIEGWHIFISTISVTLYTNSNTFILGLFTNNTIVGYYTAAEKLIKALTLIPLSPIAQSTYPYISKLVSESREKALHFIRKILIIAGGGSLIYSCLIFYLTEEIVKIVAGNMFYESIIILKIFAFLPFVITLNNMFGMQTMLNFGYKDAFSKIFLTFGIVNLFIVSLLTMKYGFIGTSIAALIIETLIPFAMWFFLRTHGIILITLKNKHHEK